jgi:outer membrane lipoprotein carrier protein
MFILVIFWIAGVALADGEDETEIHAASVSAALEVEPLKCGPDDARQMAMKIQDRYDGIRDIHSNFEQRNESASFAGQPLMTAEAKTGRVVFAKPGKMRWTYLAPEPSEVVSNGKLLWIYDVEGRSITRLEVTAGFLSGAALQFLLGDGQILESFDVVTNDCQPSRVTLILHPKAEATYEQLGLVADRETGELLATSVLDLFGNLTEIRFSQTRINLDPGEEMFEMEIPEGVELIDYANYSASDSNSTGGSTSAEGLKSETQGDGLEPTDSPSE